MRSSIMSFLAAATLPAATLAHYNFEALIVNGVASSPYEYVRQTSNSNSPIDDVTSPNMVCNQGGLDAAIMTKTKTMDVKAGDEVGFTVNVEIGHPGPLAVYMSKAPEGTELSSYKGDGDWFKVYELTTSSITDAGLQWATYVNNQGIHNFTFALPEELASGNYLLRAEHIGLHAAGSKGGAQFYIGCAHLAVSGSGSGSPSPLVKFPGAYDGSEPGVQINIYYPAPTSYTAPGPAVWPKACEDHTANLAGQASDGDCTGSKEGSSPGSGAGNGSGSGGNSTLPATSAAAPAPPAGTPTKAASTEGAAANPTGAVPTAVASSAPGSGSGSGSGSDSGSNSGAPSTPSPTKVPCSKRRRDIKARRALQAEVLDF